MNGVDWNGYVATYRRLLAGINNGRDFGDLLAELAGELNVSHTWGYGPTAIPTWRMRPPVSGATGRMAKRG